MATFIPIKPVKAEHVAPTANDNPVILPLTQTITSVTVNTKKTKMEYSLFKKVMAPCSIEWDNCTIISLPGLSLKIRLASIMAYNKARTPLKIERSLSTAIFHNAPFVNYTFKVQNDCSMHNSI